MRTKLLHALARMSIRAPWAVVITAVLITTLSLFLTMTRLEIHTDQDDLISEKLDYHHRYKNYLREFGDQEYMYVVVEAGDNLPRAKAFVRDVSARLKTLKDVKEVTYQISNPALEKGFLLYLSTQQLQQMTGFLTNSPTSIQTIATWNNLTPIFRAMNNEFAKPVDDTKRDELTMGFTFISELLDGMLGAMQADKPYQSSLQKLFFGSDRQFDEEGYLLSDNGKLLFIMIMPEKNYKELSVVEKPLAEIRGALNATRASFPDVKAGLTGRPVLAADEMSISNSDMTIATILALIAVTLLFVLYFKRMTRPLMAVTALSMGICWTFGMVTLTIGYLNILSIVFAVVLVGAGIEFGLQIVARYREELETHHNVKQAIETCITKTGKGNMTACLTTAAGFYSAMLTKFLALQELGFIAGTGIILVLFAMFTVLPALLYIWDRNKKKAHLHTTISVKLNILEKFYRRPTLILAVMAAVTIMLLPQLRNLSFDHNLLNLQAKGLESVEYEEKIIENSNQSTWFAIIPTQTEIESIAFADRLKGLSTVGRVETIQDIVPPDQDEKIKIIAKLAAEYRGTQFASISSTIDKYAFTQEMRRLQQNIDNVSDQAFKSGFTDAVNELETLNEKVGRIRSLLAQGDPGVISRLTNYQGAFLVDFQQKLMLLSTGLNPVHITMNDLPTSIRNRFYSPKTGRYVLYAYPKYNIWEPDKMETFIRDLRSVDANVLGVPVEVYESSKLMQKSFKQTALYALFFICLIVFLDFKSWKYTVLAISPLAAGLLWLFILMGLFRIPFNLANFFSIPILLGVGVDNGVQIIHRFRQEHFSSRIMTRSTGTAVLLTSLTTLCSFGAMLIASHRGVRSLGLIMTLGVLTCLIGSMVLLPAILKKIGRE